MGAGSLQALGPVPHLSAAAHSAVHEATGLSSLTVRRTFVHLVNAVLLPFYTTVANAAERAGLTTLVAAVAASDPAFLAAVTDPTFRGTILAPSVSTDM